MKILSRLTVEQRSLLWQIIRYAVTGLFVTACQATIYWILAAPVGLHPQLANAVGYLAAVGIGYVTHSLFTFRDQVQKGNHGQRTARFAVASLISYAINAFWVWWFVSHMAWPKWSPIPAMLFITPLLMFVINRKWVFR